MLDPAKVSQLPEVILCVVDRKREGTSVCQKSTEIEDNLKVISLFEELSCSSVSVQLAASHMQSNYIAAYDHCTSFEP